MASPVCKPASALFMFVCLMSQLAACAGKDKKDRPAPGAIIIAFEYFDGSKIQSIQLLGQDGNSIDPDVSSTSISDYAKGIEFETGHSKNFLFKALPFETFKTVKVAGPSQSMELDVSALEWVKTGPGLSKDSNGMAIQYDSAYITVLDSRSKPLFPK